MKKRITVTCLSDVAASFYEKGSRRGHFRPIAHPPMGWGTKGCGDTEASYYESIASLNSVAREEKSEVFILGFGPRMVPSSWIKAAELIIQGSEVEVVLIPLCSVINGDRNDPVITGTLLYVDGNGIFRAEDCGELLASEFWNYVTESAKLRNW